jgi:hypothetical protein
MEADGRLTYFIRSAALSAASSSASLKGLNRHSAAPYAMRRERIVLSPPAVIKDNRNVLPPMSELLLKVGARHPRHRDVQEQTPRFADDVRGEERFGGCKCLGGKAELTHQIGKRLANRLVIVDDRQ